MVNYVDIDYDDTTLYDPLGESYEVVSAWDAVNLKAVATLIFDDPKAVGNWDIVYSWLLLEIKVSDVNNLVGSGYISLGSDESEGANETVFDIANLATVAEGTIGIEYDKFRIPMTEFISSTFSPTNIKRVTVSLDATAEVVIKWRKARLVHLAESADVSTWFTYPYVELTVDSSKIDDELSFFPLRVVFDESDAGFAMVMQDKSTSFIVVDGAGNPQYTFVEAFDKFTCVLWILAESISDVADTTFKLYYDTTGTMVNGRYNVTSIWPSKYPFVIHMNEVDNKIIDCGSHHFSCTPYGAKNVRVGGLRGLQFMGTSQYVKMPIETVSYMNGMIDDGQITIECEPSGVVQNTYAGLFSIAYEDDPNMQMVSIMWAGSNVVAQFSNMTNGRTTLTCAAPSVTGRAVIVVKWTGGVGYVYVNGVLGTSGSIPTMDLRSDIYCKLFGNTYNGEYGSDEQFEGIGYSVETLAVGTSDAWIKADYHNRVGSLVTKGSVPGFTGLYSNSIVLTVLASPTNELDYYPVDITVHSGEGITRFNDVYLGVDCRVDMRDVLFVDSDGVPMYYTVMDTDGTTYSTYVVRFTDIPDSGLLQFTMYYNYSDSPDYDEPELTYDDFDGFDSTVISRHWTKSGNPTLNAGTIELTDDDLILRAFGFTTDAEVMFKSKVSEQDASMAELRDAIGYTNRLALYNSDADIANDFNRVVPDAKKDGYSLGVTEAVTWSDVRDYHFYRIKRVDGKVIFMQDDNMFELTDELYIPVVELFPGVCVWDDSQESTTTVDWFAVRRSYDSPPLVVWWGDVLTKFGFKKTIEVGASPDGAFDEYQLDLTIWRDKGTDDSQNVYIGAHCRSDYRDIIFTDSSGNVLSHWIESEDIHSASVVIKFTDIPATGSVMFYMYYQSNYVGKISDYKATIGSGRESTTNPPSIIGVTGPTGYNDPSSFAYKRTFTVTPVTNTGWYQAICIIWRKTGISIKQNVCVDDHVDGNAGDILITSNDGTEIIEYTIFSNDANKAIVRMYFYVTPTSDTTYWMYYNKSLTDNRRDPVVTLN